MIDLTEYGFEEGAKTEKCVEYIGRGYRVNVYNYFVMTFGGSEIIRHTFVVSTERYTYRARPIEELAEWLQENNIHKKQQEDAKGE